MAKARGLDGQSRRADSLIAAVNVASVLSGRRRYHLRHACKLGCEGIVSKRADSPYRSGRSRDWIKTKSPAAIAAQRVRSENWNK